MIEYKSLYINHDNKTYKVYKTSKLSIANNLNSVIVIISDGELVSYDNNQLDNFNHIVDCLKNDFNYKEL